LLSFYLSQLFLSRLYHLTVTVIVDSDSNMPSLKLQFKCELDGVCDVTLGKSNDLYVLKTQCPGCQTQNDNVHLLRAEQVEVPNSRGYANLVIKCKFCAKVGTMLLDEEKSQPLVSEEQGGEFITFAAVEVRNVDIVQWQLTPGALFSCISGGDGSGKKQTFDGIDLSPGGEGQGDWYDFDERAQAPVSITEVETRITR
jgi:hypothetical protein